MVKWCDVRRSRPESVCSRSAVGRVPLQKHRKLSRAIAIPSQVDTASFLPPGFWVCYTCCVPKNLRKNLTNVYFESSSAACTGWQMVKLRSFQSSLTPASCLFQSLLTSLNLQIVKTKICSDHVLGYVEMMIQT